jgi:plastocyanin domain-containing protein
MMGRGLVLSGVTLPSLPSSSTTAKDTQTTAEIKDGVQNITSTLPPIGYPNITVQKGVPVVWNLKADASAINGCNRTMIISEYNVQVQLKAGDNIIKFTPTESGTITYSCWMGMQTGRISVVNDLNNKTAQAATDASAASAGVVSGGSSCCTGSASSG